MMQEQLRECRQRLQHYQISEHEVTNQNQDLISQLNQMRNENNKKLEEFSKKLAQEKENSFSLQELNGELKLKVSQLKNQLAEQELQ